MHRSLVLLLFFVYFSGYSVENAKVPLSRNELKQKYGQENTNFNDNRSCLRNCDGKARTCYYEFNVQVFDTMSGLCHACGNRKISDCFNKGCIPGNGIKRTIMTINQQLPAPKISVCKTDRIIVDVTNHMPGQQLTFHWHGLHQRESPWFDGVPMVTQCPISEGNTFRYMFNARDVGTHFYHAHSGVHRINGLFGMLNVRDVSDSNSDYYDYDLDEHSIILADWNNRLAEESVPGTSLEHLFPESILINGFGTYTDPHTQQFYHAPIATFYVEKGKRHRFRIGNVGAHICPFEISFKGYNMIIIATDGYPIEPIVVESLVTLSGERFDIVLSATNDPNISETIMTVRGLDRCKMFKNQEFARVIFVDDITNYSPKVEDHEPLEDIPAYESLNFPKISLNDPNTDCTNSSSYCVAALQHKPAPDDIPEDLRKDESKMIQLNYETTYMTRRPHVYRTSRDYAMVAMINGIASSHPPVPGLVQDDSAVPYCNANNMTDNCDKDIDGSKVCYCPHLIDLELGKVYEVLLHDDEEAIWGISHSLHLHGHRFQVIDMGTLDQLKRGHTAFTNATHLPVIRDTVVMPGAGFVRIRFRANNPGYWIFHCHLEFHMTPGMMTVFRVGNRSDFLTPPQNFPKCGHYLTPAFD